MTPRTNRERKNKICCLFVTNRLQFHFYVFNFYQSVDSIAQRATETEGSKPRRPDREKFIEENKVQLKTTLSDRKQTGSERCCR